MLKIMFLFLGVWFSIINGSKLKYGQELSAINMCMQSVGIVGFIVIQFGL